jgi:hypothetical protein
LFYTGLELGLSLYGKNTLRVFENRVLKRIFGLRKKVVQDGENCIMESFVICIVRLI